MIEFFLHRRLFAAVLSIIVFLAGMIVIPTLPVALYPQIAPPTVTVTATYVGANAESVERSVTAPLERAINGTDGLQYISSYSNSSGTSSITCTFEIGTDPNTDTSNVQRAVDLTASQLPSQVQRTGISVQKSGSGIVIAVALQASRVTSQTALSNYASRNVIEELKRIPGVANVLLLGDRTYAMRVWVDPIKLQGYGLTGADVANAISDQNTDVAPGSVGAPPTGGNQAYEIPIRLNGRMESPRDFADMVIASTPDGGFIRLRDVARIELGAQSYGTAARYDGRDAIVLAIQQQAAANSLDISRDVRATMQRLSPSFPSGVAYSVAFDTAEFVRNSIREVLVTLLIAILLVVVVIFVFLADWQTTLIPAITIPVSLVGTFALMGVLGFTINSLTLFGLTLATGLVVDDAIVVIENIARYMQEHKMGPLEAARNAMAEISGAVVATSLVLMSVFVPVAFLPGTTGQLYKQFALTIAASIAISLFTALTLAPVLSLSLVHGKGRAPFAFLRWWSARLDALRSRYSSLVPRLVGARWAVVALYAGALVLTVWLFRITPTGFIPDEDQSVLYVLVQAPVGSSLDYTQRKVTELERVLKGFEEVDTVTSGIGFGFFGNSSNVATLFARLRPLSERKGITHRAKVLQLRIYVGLHRIAGVTALPVNPPAVPGLGASGGFAFLLQDRANLGLDPLISAGNTLLQHAAASPKLTLVRVPTPPIGPYLFMTVDRQKAMSFGVDPSAIFNVLQTTTGATYVNDFDYLDRSYRVYVQSDVRYRRNAADLSRTYVASSSRSLMPVSMFVTTSVAPSNVSISRFNLYRSFEIDGSPSSGTSSGEALTEMQGLAAGAPRGFGYDWSGLAREQVKSGPQTIVIFVLAIVLTFLVLVAQYESIRAPFVIMLAVPLALLGAIGAIFLRHFVPYSGIEDDVYVQIGCVMLVGLSAKNAILIVEFANQLRAAGASLVDAVTRAAATRLRPILMTSMAFMLGILPLVLANGDGAASRISLGTAVFGGMLISTALNLAVVPVLYVTIMQTRERQAASPDAAPRAVEPAPEATPV